MQPQLSARPAINWREISTTAALAAEDAHSDQEAGRPVDGADSDDEAIDDDDDDDTQDTTGLAEMSGPASSAAVFPAASTGCGALAIARRWGLRVELCLFFLPLPLPSSLSLPARRERYWAELAAVSFVGGAGTFETSEV